MGLSNTWSIAYAQWAIPVRRARQTGRHAAPASEPGVVDPSPFFRLSKSARKSAFEALFRRLCKNSPSEHPHVLPTTFRSFQRADTLQSYRACADLGHPNFQMTAQAL